MKKKLLVFLLAFSAIVVKAQFPNPYCGETYPSGVEPITSVVFSNINNTSPNAIGGTAHQDFLSVIGNVTAGNSYTITVKGNTDGPFTDFIRVFIDWNNNNLFTDAGESFNIGTINNSDGLDAINANASIAIPVGQPTGNRRMRVTKKYNIYQDPCNAAGFGESEDYTLSITAASGCSGTPSAGTISGPAGACSGVAFNLTNSGATTGTGLKYSWQSAPAAIGPWTNLNNTTSLVTPFSPTQTVVTYYRMVDTCISSGQSAISNVLQVNMNGFLNCYCLPTYSSGCSGDNIDSVSLGTLNDGGQTCSPIYADRSSVQPGTLAIPDLNAGSSASLYIRFGSDANQYNGVWIDFNQNGNFETTEFFSSNSNTGSGGNVSISIAIPAGAIAGNTKMRIRGGDDVQPTSAQACGASASAWGSARDYLVNILPASGCSGTPAAPVITGPAAACSGVNFTLTASSFPPQSGINYAWQSSASAGGPWTNIAGQTNPASATASQTAITFYRLVDTCTNGGGSNISNVVQVNMTTVGCPPPNDLVCNAINLNLGGAADCQNTSLATATGDPALPGSCSSPNNTVWYTYTPVSSGTVIVRTEIPGATANALNGWVVWYTATGTCPSLTLTPVGGSVCQEFGQSGAGDVDSLISVSLTGGTTYYIMIDGFGGDNGEFCINLLAPPPPPVCVNNISPANGATGVTSVTGNVPLTWNPAPGAASYDVYFGTTNPPTVNIGNVAATTANITGTNYNTTYYWYVVPRNVGGPATGCSTNTTSFTTENPTNCVPSYTTGCTAADSITYFSLKGASGSVIYNQSGGTCSTTPRGYSDYTAVFPAVTLARGETFGGFMRTGDANNYVSIWIDEDDDGYFEDNERILSNLKIGLSLKLYSVYIPTTMSLGNHRMRVRNIYSGTVPNTATHPCNTYTWGETEDYLVNITNVGTTRSVAPGTPGSCQTGSETTINALSNNINAPALPVFILDSSNNYIAGIYPNGNNLGTVRTKFYVHNGPVRQDPSGRYYMDRNLTITADTQPSGNYNLRYFFLNSELNALIAQPGSGVTSIFDLYCTKNGDTCRNAVNFGGGPVVSPTGFGSISGDRFIDMTGLSGFSSFYLHGGNLPIPVKVEYFRGTKQASSHVLDWKVSCTNTQFAKMTVELSTDGRNFSGIYSIRETAVRCQQPFSFTNINPVAGISYYRLRMEDDYGVVSYSSIVALMNGIKGFELVNIAPNPVTEGRFKLNITSAEQKKMDVLVTDLSGRIVLKQTVNIIPGFNAVDMNVSKLAGGTYQLFGITSEGKTRVLQFVRQ